MGWVISVSTVGSLSSNQPREIHLQPGRCAVAKSVLLPTCKTLIDKLCGNEFTSLGTSMRAHFFAASNPKGSFCGPPDSTAPPLSRHTCSPPCKTLTCGKPIWRYQ